MVAYVSTTLILITSMLNIKKTTKLKIYVCLGLIVLLFLLTLFLCSGGNIDLIRSVFMEEHTDEELREKLLDLGFRGYATVAILSMLQVVFTVLPAEPVQVLAGLGFGFPIGLLCCTVGVLLGNSLIFILYRIYGDRVREFFFKNLNLDFKRAAESNRVALIIFVLYFLPAIPYGMICFFASSVGMKYPRYITITLLGSIPSICIGVALGHIALVASWALALAIFVILLVLVVIGIIKKDALFAKLNAYIEKAAREKNNVRRCNPIVINLAFAISQIIIRLRGVKVRSVNKLGRQIDSPSIVLCSHGSFIDFIYAGAMIRKKRPNFIVARLYFYHKWLAALIRSVGCFPKSMFTTDFESAKNSLRVLRGGGVLAMMPEARLSTAGVFEDIQPGTYSFLKSAKVPIYSIKLSGNYLADPKWGSGMRRGGLVEAELDILFTAEELKTLTVEQIKERVDARLYFNDFEWLKAHPEVHYRSKKLAHGLENILVRCPRCLGYCTLTTHHHDVSCQSCGKLTSLDDRYNFTADVPFDHLSEWYEWQKQLLADEIARADDYALTSHVKLRLPSLDGKTMLRDAGEGICTLNRQGLTYEGTVDGQEKTLSFPMAEIYRLLFGAGENFEIYMGNQIYYFVPDEKRSCVLWYLASMILKDTAQQKSELTTSATLKI